VLIALFQSEFVGPRPENLEPAPAGWTHTIEIERFLPAGQIDARYFENRITLCARADRSVIRDAMRREGVIGLARGRRRHIENGDRQQLLPKRTLQDELKVLASES